MYNLHRGSRFIVFRERDGLAKEYTIAVASWCRLSGAPKVPITLGKLLFDCLETMRFILYMDLSGDNFPNSIS